jgi:hypothetical protein
MAIDGEELPDGPEPPPLPPGHRRLELKCRVSGEPVSGYFEPVVEFARKNLVRRLTDDAQPEDARAFLVETGMKHRQPRDGIEITVDPRSVVGSLTTMIKRGGWDAGDVYCIHVLHSDGTTTIVVKERSTWIK